MGEAEALIYRMILQQEERMNWIVSTKELKILLREIERLQACEKRLHELLKENEHG